MSDETSNLEKLLEKLEIELRDTSRSKESGRVWVWVALAENILGAILTIVGVINGATAGIFWGVLAILMGWVLLIALTKGKENLTKKEKDLENKIAETQNDLKRSQTRPVSGESPTSTSAKNESKSESLERDLTKAKKMLEDGLITLDEFNTLKKKLIDNI